MEDAGSNCHPEGGKRVNIPNQGWTPHRVLNGHLEASARAEIRAVKSLRHAWAALETARRASDRAVFRAPPKRASRINDALETLDAISSMLDEAAARRNCAVAG